MSLTNVVVEGDRPIGILTNHQKVSWTRYHYAPLHGGLEYVGKYHTITTDEGKLGENYYRTTYIRDQLGEKLQQHDSLITTSGKLKETDLIGAGGLSKRFKV